MFDVYGAGDKLIASHALLRDAIGVLAAEDNALAYIVERETNITLAIDNEASKLRFMLGAKAKGN
jgi:hypothetical protein